MRVHNRDGLAGETSDRGCHSGRHDRDERNNEFDEDTTTRGRHFHGNSRGRGNFGHGPYCRCHFTNTENFENTRAGVFGGTGHQHDFEFEGERFAPHFGETGGPGWFGEGASVGGHNRDNGFARDNMGRNAFEMPSRDRCGHCGGMRGRGGFGPFGGMRGRGSFEHFRGGMGDRCDFGHFGGMRGRGGFGPFGRGMRGGLCGTHSRGGPGGFFGGDSRFHGRFGGHVY